MYAKLEHPFFDMGAKKAIKWVNSIDSVLIAKTKGLEAVKSKIAAFDLVKTWCSITSYKLFTKM